MTKYAVAAILTTLVAARLPAQHAPLVMQATRDQSISGSATHLTRIGSWMGVSRNGTIVLLEPSDHAVLFFSAGGKALGAVGNEGEGLGGFAALSMAGWIGDTVWVNDPILHRATLISLKPAAIRTVSMSTDLTLSSGDAGPFAAAGGVLLPFPWGMYADGTTLLFSIMGPDAPMPADWHRPADASGVLVHVAASGVLKNVVAWIPGSGGCSVTITKTANFGLPFCAPPMQTPSADGRWVGVGRAATRGLDSGMIMVTSVGERGDTVFSRKYPYAGIAVPQHDVDSAIQFRVASVRTRIPEAVPILQAYHATVYPPLVSVLVGQDSSIWIEQNATVAGRPWLVLDAKGNPLGTVTVPSDLRIKVASRTTIWGMEGDPSRGFDIVRSKLKRP